MMGGHRVFASFDDENLLGSAQDFSRATYDN